MIGTTRSWGSSYRVSDGERVADGYDVDVPVSLRLDFGAGPGAIWFVSAIPDVSEPDDAFVNGDEIMVVFTAEKMRRLGFPDDEFVRHKETPCS
ncbi:hypothetical protein OHA18_11090 [Kribbella sp. NBC_00709]|uniref:hypothetical protein n=1 Tax=Kribbella sp. NBC_00709 TaxID=2975972 RepID=UPI002E28C9AA|nr:hypothetical protein [Kribbella sp. NBC_00709]